VASFLRLAICCGFAAAPATARADAFCDAIREFAQAPLESDDSGGFEPRHVELFWRGPWGIYNIGYECRHRGDRAGQVLCRTLTEHMPQEFRTSLPFRIMRCYGYSFPAYVDSRWNSWSAEIELANAPGGRLRLDISLYQPGDLRDAIRLAVIPASYDLERNPLPSLREPIPQD
jgi:hypothetical protein